MPYQAKGYGVHQTMCAHIILQVYSDKIPDLDFTRVEGVCLTKGSYAVLYFLNKNKYVCVDTGYKELPSPQAKSFIFPGKYSVNLIVFPSSLGRC